MSEKSARLLKSNSLEAKAARSTLLTVLNFGGQNVIRLASNLILTRLLFPEVFGLMALVQVVLGGLQLFSDIGIREAVIQDKEGGTPKFLNTAWVITIVRGFILWFATILLAAPIADFYNAPQLAEILPVAGFTTVLLGFNSTNVLVADRNLAIGRLTAMTLGTQLVGAVLMTLLAWWWQSIWALVIGGLISAFVMAVLSHVVLPGARSRFVFDPKIAWRIVGFGKYILLATVAAFIVAHADRAVLGKYVPLDVLAIYSIGLMLAMVPTQVAQALAARIVFPLYSQIPPAESAESRRRINRARRAMTAGLLFGTAILVVIGIELVEILYDVRYEAAGPLVVLIALALIPRIVMLSYYRLTTAAGHTGKFAIITVSVALLQLGALLIGVQLFGLGGAAIAPAVGSLLFYPMMLYLIRQYRGWDPLHDAIGFGIFLLLTAFAFWFHGDALIPLFSPT